MSEKSYTKKSSLQENNTPPLKKRRESTPQKLQNDDICSIDSSYKYRESKLKRANQPFHFSPEYFLRTHSKNNDPADVQTQIWQCAFEPDKDDPKKHTNIVATCGGTSVCFIDVNTGTVKLKYGQQNAKMASPEILYAVAWSTIPLNEFGSKKMNVLATGGAKCTVALIHPSAGCRYKVFRTVSHKQLVINSLLFHPKKASWLFCAHDDGHIQLWDIGVPPLPSYEVNPRKLLEIAKVGGEMYNMVFSEQNDLLIAGCELGLYAWKVDMEKVEKCHRLDCTEVILPDPKEDDTVVDSICLVRDNVLAAKCALHGCIYLFNLKETLKKATKDKSSHQSKVTLKSANVLKLKWSDTDNYYMNMGCDQNSGVLVCGDDEGTLWVYDLYRYLSGEIQSPLFDPNIVSNNFVEPVTLLRWPDLEDPEVEKARKLRLDSHEIVINCTISENGEHIVAVTNNNMVCIWMRSEPEEEEED